jgi:adenylosuccinate lyase
MAGDLSAPRGMSLLCPIDFRYGRPKMKGIFEEGTRLQRLLDVEAALARAEAKVGLIPQEAAAEIARKATTKHVTVERVEALEQETRHDLMAVVLALTEACDGNAGKYVHLGATSNDILDTATALQLQDAIRLIEADLGGLIEALADLAGKHKKTIMLGRTHGQAAVPITFGLKMAVFASEVARQRARLREATPRVVVGKMSGAVGTGAAWGAQAGDLQAAVMADLGLDAEEAATQVVGRDRYAEFIGVLANLAASLEKFCTEVRNLQRTEIAEVAEAFETRKQVGSSTMAHKENPIASENVCSLARIVRSLMTPALENVSLWHERDLTNSAAERILIPHACVLIDEMLARTTEVFRTLRVYPERMKENLEATKGQVMAEAVMMALVGKGLGRQEAHKLVRDAALLARTRGIHLRDSLVAEPKIAKLLSKQELDAALDPTAYLGQSMVIVDAVAKRLS